MLFTEIPQSMTTQRQFPPLSYMYKQDQGSRAPSNAGHWREIIFDPKKVHDANVCQKKISKGRCQKHTEGGVP